MKYAITFDIGTTGVKTCVFGISDTILNKPGKLTEEELAAMKKEDREFVKKIVGRRRSVTKLLYEAAADICM